MKSLSLLVMFAANLCLASEGRLDPHGPPDQKPSFAMIRERQECRFCHMVDGSGFKTIPVTNETCWNCHNQSPHSGVQEHRKHDVGCIKCHSPHRGSNLAGLQKEPASSRTLSQQIELPENSKLRIREKSGAMLIKTCTDCHKW